MRKRVLIAGIGMALVLGTLMTACGQKNSTLSSTESDGGVTTKVETTVDIGTEATMEEITIKETTTEKITIEETTAEEITMTDSTVAESTEKEKDSEGEAVYEATLEEVFSLLNKKDEETAEMLGGGEENWTQDKKFYIGRIYQIQMDGQKYPVHTSCDEEKVVNAVSMWISNGDRTVSEEEVEQWVEKFKEYAGFEGTYDGTTSEGGSKNWDWRMGDWMFSLRWLEDNLAMNANLIMGELH